MQQNIEFERCIDFLVRMIDKYGDEVLRDTSRDISRYAVCHSYIDGKKTQRYNKKEFTVFSLLKLSLIHICVINEADGWRGRNVWYPGRSVRYALKEVTIA